MKTNKVCKVCGDCYFEKKDGTLVCLNCGYTVYPDGSAQIDLDVLINEYPQGYDS